jgi:type III restriction enzyme
MSEQLIHEINSRLSLREPQRHSLQILAEVLSRIELSKEGDLGDALDKIATRYPQVEDFERDFPSLCFALATGVGKTRLMGAFITYLYRTGRSKNFFVLAPNLTIYDKLIADFTPGTPKYVFNKLIADFTPGTPKYVFKGIAEFARTPPQVVTGDTYQDGRGLRRQGEMFAADCIINIFNISKINSEVRGGRSPRIKRLQEYIGESYFEYLSRLPDLALLMDEAHRYRATAGARAINELKPILGLELTATPKDFKNVIYRYGLGDAMADGFVKEPAVATRANFNPAQHNEEELERIKLEDGIHHHEHVKIRLELYARRLGVKPVHPFMLVVAQNIQHAKELRSFLEADTFFDGRYKGKVVEVHSGQGAAERDKSERELLALENDRTTEIVVHVNKLNEGWDVTNLYTIVPLRAFAAEILTEQTLGRGLRLPYGERTGDEAVDRLTIIAHDHFEEIVRRARAPGSIVMKEVRIGAGGDIPAEGEQIVEAKPIYETRLSESLGGTLSEMQKRVLQVMQQVVDEESRRLTGFRELETPEIQGRIAARVEEIMRPVQRTLDGLVAELDVREVVSAYTANLVRHSIEIPEIWIRPSRRDVTFGFNDFDLQGLDSLGVRPLDGRILIRNIRTGEYDPPIEVETVGAKEPLLENYLVRRLVDHDEVDYDQHSELLYKLAGQLVDHLKSYLRDHEVEAVLRSHAPMLSEFIFRQMLEPGHYWETPTTYEPVVTKGFKRLGGQPYGVQRNLPIMDFRTPVTPRGDTRKYLFTGFKKCCFDTQRFHSDDERRFAVLVDEREPEVKAWLKPGSGVFQITYARGQNYEPDFIVETRERMFICEVKSRNDMNDPTVQAKARAAREYIEAANQVAAQTGRKSWKYALIPHDAVADNATLPGLIATFG